MYFIGGSEGASGRVLEDEATLIGGLLTSPVGRMEPRQDREESA